MSPLVVHAGGVLSFPLGAAAPGLSTALVASDPLTQTRIQMIALERAQKNVKVKVNLCFLVRCALQSDLVVLYCVCVCAYLLYFSGMLRGSSCG